MQSVKLISVSKEYEYDYTECKCQNNGICVLDNDFCVCQPGFTGKYCEINIEKDFALGCGKMLNNEYEYTKCSKCQCKNQLLTCDAITTPQCDSSLLENFQLNSKNIQLKTLIKLMNEMETNAYNYYINEYSNQLGYEIKFKFIDNDDSDDSTSLDVLNTNKLIVFKTRNNKITGIYFPKLTQQFYNSSSQFFNLNLVLFSLNFIIFYAYKLLF